MNDSEIKIAFEKELNTLAEKHGIHHVAERNSYLDFGLLMELFIYTTRHGA